MLKILRNAIRLHTIRFITMETHTKLDDAFIVFARIGIEGVHLVGDELHRVDR